LKKVSYLSGGVGGAKFAKGLYQIKNIDLNIIVNTGDDEVINGVFLSPDIDTVIYNLAGIEGKFGWGIKNDKFTVHNHLNKFLKSNFMIGDKDLATNLFRSQQLNNGKSLTEVTEEIKNKFKIKCNIFPMSDSIVSTKLLTKTGKKLDFQKYFVEKKGRPRLKKIIYEGSKLAKVSNTLFKEIKNSDIVIIGPSNPFLSIGPILSLKQIKKVLTEHQNVIVISPFINNKALKGPSKNNFLDMGLTPDIHGLKQFYKNIGNKFIVHFEDSDNSSNTYEENIIFNSNKDSEKLASKIMAL
jgi:LPPG:FO 2-phospho-L-lactate transferase